MLYKYEALTPNFRSSRITKRTSKITRDAYISSIEVEGSPELIEKIVKLVWIEHEKNRKNQLFKEQMKHPSLIVKCKLLWRKYVNRS